MVSFSGRRLRCRRQKEYGDWSNIASDLLEYIQKMLPLPDVLRCRSVCRSWRSITKTHLLSSLKPPPPPSPPLILCRKDSSDDTDSDSFELDDADEGNRFFIDPSDYDHYSDSDSDSDSDSSELEHADEGNRFFIDELKTDDGGNLNVPENHKFEQLLAGMKDCVGYSHGYFLFSDRNKKSEETLYLFHPTLFSGTLARFPLIRVPKYINDINRMIWFTKSNKDKDYYLITKVILWADPISGNNGNYGMFVIHEGSRRLLFAKCGATRFTQLERQSMGTDSFIDIICIRNCIYGITKHYVKAWDCSTSTIEDHGVPKKVLNFKPKFSKTDDPTCNSGTSLRLVELQGQLLLVAIMSATETNVRGQIKGEGGRSEYNKIEPMFKVYNMDFKKKKWVRMISLGAYVLLITEFQAVFLSSHEFPQYQKNSIYFSGYFLIRTEQHHLGIFSMEDGSIKLIEARRKC